MKKTLLLMMALFGSFAVQAQDEPQPLTESPWTSAELTAEGGTYFLYNVESGMWLQNNRRDKNLWTTHMQLGPHGMDFIITALADGAYQIDPRFGHNHSINGDPAADYGYMDTGRDVTPWFFTKTVSGLGYTIATAEEIGAIYVISAAELGDDFEGIDNGFYIDNVGYPDLSTFQLVSKEARLADLAKATKANPKDATWLIDDWDFATANDRHASWIKEITGSGSGFAFNQGWRPNRAVECWSGGHGKMYQTITGLPNGTYGLTVQGFYRDGSTSGVVGKREAGEETIRAWYFANDAQQPFMSIIDNGVTEEIPDVYAATSGFFGPGDGGSALPRASNGFYLGYYKNAELKVVVSDGTLTIGVSKESDTNDDWLVFDNFELTYYGSDIDIEEVKGNLRNALDEAAAYEGTELPVLASAKSAGETAMNSADAATISKAATALQQALAATKAMNAALASAESVNGAAWKPNFFTTAFAAAQAASQAIDAAEVSAAAAELSKAVDEANGGIDAYTFYNATMPLALADGVAQSIIDATKPAIEASESLGEMNDALNQLRIARKIAAADKQEDVFAGNAPQDQINYYIYNVGLKRYLCGGGDWGAHAYVGFPGQEVTLIEDEVIPEEGEGYSGFQIDTHLNNGGESEFLNYGGYMDTPTRDLWEFIPVEGKPGVYNIARANGETNTSGQRMLLGYRPGTYGNIDTDMYGESDPNNQWKLVTAYDRDELLKTATNDKPQDASYKISCPNFNQRDEDLAWVRETENGSIYGRGGNNPDFAYECWNANPFTLSQTVYDLEPGWYVLSCNGYYREGNHQNQVYLEGIGAERRHAGILFAELKETEMMNILDEADKAPGLGDRRRVSLMTDEEQNTWADFADNGEFYAGEFPMWIYQACDFFQTGLYKNYVLVEVTPQANGELYFGVMKDFEMAEDWIVCDNFRLTYYGTQMPNIDAIETVRDEVAKTKSESRTYNLQGMQVKGQLQRGLYIKDGKKVIVK